MTDMAVARSGDLPIIPGRPLPDSPLECVEWLCAHASPEERESIYERARLALQPTTVFAAMFRRAVRERIPSSVRLPDVRPCPPGSSPWRPWPAR